MDDRERIRAFVTENFYVDGARLDDGESLLERGVIDSTGVLELIGFLEKQFGIRVEEKEMVPQNLDSIAGAAAFVARKRAGGARAA